MIALSFAAGWWLPLSLPSCTAMRWACGRGKTCRRFSWPRHGGFQNKVRTQSQTSCAGECMPLCVYPAAWGRQWQADRQSSGHGPWPRVVLRG